MKLLNNNEDLQPPSITKVGTAIQRHKCNKSSGTDGNLAVSSTSIDTHQLFIAFKQTYDTPTREFRAMNSTKAHQIKPNDV